jgi:hypothetical protein
MRMGKKRVVAYCEIFHSIDQEKLGTSTQIGEDVL